MSECPGTQTKNAGKEKACQDCPNASYCLTEKKPDPDVETIRNKFLQVKRCIAIMSGKGGVGKSFVSKNIAHTLSTQGTTLLLDFDLTGPSIPRLTKTESNIAYESDTIIYPIKISDHFYCLSVGHFYRDDLMQFNSLMKNDILKKLLLGVSLDGIEYIVIDTPPGVGDEHLGLVNLLGLTEALLVTTPQQLAFSDVVRQIDFCKKSGIRVLGIIENMKSLLCHECGHTNSVFEGSNQVQHYCVNNSIKYLGTIAIKQAIAKQTDTGEDYHEPLLYGIASDIAKSKL